MPIQIASDANFQNLARQMNKLADQFQKGYFAFSPDQTWTPSVNLYETETAYLVCVDLSGVDKDKIDVTVADNQLKLRGHRHPPTLPESAGVEAQTTRLRVHLMEIDNGAFCREVDLPNDVAQESIRAQYRDGLLWIELPKR